MGQGHPGRPNPPPTQAIGANCATPHESHGHDTARYRTRIFSNAASTALDRCATREARIHSFEGSCDFTCILSHLMGTFYQTIHMLGHGIKPVYAFDGKPPQLKRRAEAENLLAQVQETGEQENIDKFTKRLVKVTRQHNDECKKLLTLMGVPYIKVCLKFCSFP
uniref:XPG N-terminal domain-containing protein n=1 Tax=Oncorhynchus kisutch TaxID=8019 RepID=A0A8C7N5D2_ONCKI